ncbi:MAG: hypothetical protein ACFE9S_15600 [Candidatus Hermodarchaeota archaeon]
MVISNNRSQLCLHSKIGENREGFLVCKECGLILDEFPKLVNDDPYHRTYTHIKHSNFHREASPLLSTSIGTKMERILNSKYRIYSKSNHYKYNYNDILKIKTINETSRLLSLLQLPITLKNEVIEKSLLFYSQFPKASNFRNPLILTPIALYLICKEKIIFIKKKKICEISNIETIVKFNKILFLILQNKNNKSLCKTFKDDDLRKKQILAYISRFIFQIDSNQNSSFLIIKKLSHNLKGLTAKELSTILDIKINTIQVSLRNLLKKNLIVFKEIHEKGYIFRLFTLNKFPIKELHFNNFLSICKKIINKYWELIKNQENKVITGLVFSLAKDVFTFNLSYRKILSYNFTDNKFSKFLNIQQSSIHSAKRKFTGYILNKTLKEVLI